jgi:hypothetical protein
LLRERLLDGLHLFFIPLVAGSGKRPFGSPDQNTPGPRVPLQLLGSATFPAGAVHLTFAKE